MTPQGLISRLAAAARDRRGMAATEFALVAPILIALFMGTYEVTNVALVDMKLTSAAQTAADLVAQTMLTGGGATTVLNNASFVGFTNAAQKVMTPFPATDKNNNPTLKMAYASFTYTGGAPVLSWHYEENGAAAITANAIPNNQDLTKLGTASSNDSVVVVSAQYNYTSPISFVLKKSYTFNEAAFDRPRYVTAITTCQNQPNANGCP